MPEPAPPPATTGEPTLGEVAAHTRTLLRRLGPGGPLALLAATLPMIGFVTLAFLFNTLGPWLRAHDGLGVLIYVLGFAGCAGLAIFPTHIQAALGGWAFGFGVGLPAALAGILGAALLGYVIALRATGDRVVQLITEKPKWRAVYDALLGSGFWRALAIVTLVRLAVSPFALTNLVMAATRVNAVAYALGTLLGIAPRTAAVVLFAVGLKAVTDPTPHKRVLWIASLVLTIIVVFIIGHIANKAVARVAGGSERERA